ncbi:MAG: vanadium-dependent haloperoxidase [Fuerstiella sp.]
MMFRLDRRTRSAASFRSVSCIDVLEQRVLLAGTVSVDLIGQTLRIRGDAQDNSVVVTPNAETVEGLVQGTDDTAVQFTNRAHRRFESKGFRNVQIQMRGGNDSVTIEADGMALSGSLRAALGSGDDTIAIAGSEQASNVIRRNLVVAAGTGNDSVFTSHIETGGSLVVSGARGNDLVLASEMQIRRRTVIRGQAGDDCVLTTGSQIDGAVRVSGGVGNDTVQATTSQFNRSVRISGQRGDDVVATDSETQFRMAPRLSSVAADVPESTVQNRIAEAAAALPAWLNQTAEFLPEKLANNVQDALSAAAADVGFEVVSLKMAPATQRVTVTEPTPSVSVLWDQAVQQAVTNTSPGPTIASRAYALMHTAMFDAWSAYDGPAHSTQLADDLQRPESENTEANKREAMSYAAYRVLDDLFASETNLLDDLMERLGFDPGNTSTSPTEPAGIGNTMAASLLTFRHDDGSNQLGDSADGTPGIAYSDTSDYSATNGIASTEVIDKWTPEHVPIDAASGSELRNQKFLTPHWGQVTPFSLTSGDQLRPQAPEPFLMVDGTVDLENKTITQDDGTVLNITSELVGTVINPAFVAQAQEVVDISAALTDEQKLIAEFWEDASRTSFPPGTFMTFGQYVSARDNHSTDQDAQMFFALANAVFDAGIATWESKTHYDYVRPVRAIRELGKLGLIGEPDSSTGEYMIRAWTPEGDNRLIPATEFLTYQTPGQDPSPPFAEYTSGHSAFSAAGATILRLFTGSDQFGGSVTFQPGTSRFEPSVTPSESVTLSWDTFTAAADEAGISRLYGGIHFSDGNVFGTELGNRVGEAVWEKARAYITGTTD